MRQIILHILSLSLVFFLCSTNAAAENQYVSAELLSENFEIEPGRQFTVGLLLKMDPGWHVYWKNPGDSGLPTTIDWGLPEGFKVENLKWPAPEKIYVGPLVNFGYKKEV